MSEQRPLFDDGDFRSLPDFPEDEFPSRPLAPQGEGKINLDVRRKPGLFVRLRPWLLAAVGLMAIVLVSWFLAGNAVWGYSAGITAVLLILLTLSGFKLLDHLRGRHFLLYGYFVLCWVAWTVVGYYWPVTEVRVRGDLVYKMEQEPDCPLRVSYRDEVLVELDRVQECSFQFRGRFQAEQLHVEMLTPEGWVTRSFKAYGKEASLEKIPLTRLYVDNRDNGLVKLGCGAWQATVKAGGHATIRLPAAPNGVHRRLTINDQEAGPLDGDNVLVDTRGTRSYRMRTVAYEGGLSRLGLIPGRDQLAPVEPVFQRAYVHKLPDEIDFFLAPAPERITVQTMYGLPLDKMKRTELQEINR
jgi:hypothetical protein